MKGISTLNLTNINYRFLKYPKLRISNAKELFVAYKVTDIQRNLY